MQVGESNHHQEMTTQLLQPNNQKQQQPATNNSKKRHQLSSEHPQRCFCRTYSRATYDEFLARAILPLVPKEEWELHWDPDSLPNSTGSKKLESFFILKKIFLFVHFDTETLLSISAVNKSWRILADRLPHWRYLLPFKYETPHLVSKLHWHLPRAFFIEEIPYEIGEEKIFETNHHLAKTHPTSTVENVHFRHMRLRQIQPYEEGFEETKQTYLDYFDPSGHGRQKAEFVRSRNKFKYVDGQEYFGEDCCSCACCCSIICCGPFLCCECGKECRKEFFEFQDYSEKEDYGDEWKLHTKRIRQFPMRHPALDEKLLADSRSGVGLVKEQEGEYHVDELANDMIVDPHQVQEQKKETDWKKLLKLPSSSSANASSATATSSSAIKQKETISSNEPHDISGEYFSPEYNSTSHVHGGVFNYEGVWKRTESNDILTTTTNDARGINFNNNKPVASSSSTQQPPRNPFNAPPPSSDPSPELVNDDEEPEIGKGDPVFENYHYNNRNHHDQKNNTISTNPYPHATVSNLHFYPNIYNGHLHTFVTRENNLLKNKTPEQRARIREQKRICDPNKRLQTSMVVMSVNRNLEAFHHRERVAKELYQNEDDSITLPILHSGRIDYIPYRCVRMTFLNNLQEIMSSPEHRRRWCYLTLSSFCEETRELIELQKQESKVDNWKDLQSEGVKFSLATLLLFGLSLILALAVPPNIESTVIAQTDLALGAFVGTLVAVCTLVYTTYTLCAADNPDHWGDYRPAARSRIYGTISSAACTMSLVVPLSLVSFRVSILNDLTNNGNMIVAVSNAYENGRPTAGSTFTPIGGSSTCESTFATRLPSFHPGALESATFAHFPKDTKILFNPSIAKSRQVPFLPSYDSVSGKCVILGNQTVSQNQNETDNNKNNEIPISADRGYPGFYTVILPPHSNALQPNITFVIFGDFPGCPFWSTNDDLQIGRNVSNNTSNNINYKTSRSNIHPRLQPVLQNETAADAISEAAKISPDLEDAMKRMNFNVSTQLVKMPCQNAANALVSVSNNNFFLRVAKGFVPHFTASYSTSSSDENIKWSNENLYKNEGIVALMADSSIFVAHENSAVPTVPELITSPFSSSSGSENPRIWTQATPQGLEKIRDDFTIGYYVLIGIVGFTCLYLCAYHVFFSKGFVRGSLVIAGVIIAPILFGLPVPSLIITTVCHDHAVDNLKDELRQPVMCLMGSKSDIVGAWVWSIVNMCLGGVVLMFMVGIICAFHRGRDEDEDW